MFILQIKPVSNVYTFNPSKIATKQLKSKADEKFTTIQFKCSNKSADTIELTPLFIGRRGIGSDYFLNRFCDNIVISKYQKKQNWACNSKEKQ